MTVKTNTFTPCSERRDTVAEPVLTAEQQAEAAKLARLASAVRQAAAKIDPVRALNLYAQLCAEASQHDRKEPGFYAAFIAQIEKGA